MKTLKRVLRPQRLRQVPAQFSWVDQALVRGHFIDRCEARAAALYLFLVTVADAQGLSYYGEATLGARLHLSPEALVAARVRSHSFSVKWSIHNLTLAPQSRLRKGASIPLLRVRSPMIGPYPDSFYLPHARCGK
jgi:hypothetical protein